MKRKMFTICLVAIVLVSFLSAVTNEAIAQEEPKGLPIKGFPEASVTIFPQMVFWVGLEGLDDEAHAWANAYNSGFREKAHQFTEMLGLLLEEKGYDKYRIADAMFEMPEGNPTRQERTTAFAKFVSQQDLKTDYALGTAFTIFTDKDGLYVYSVIVDAKGNIVWADDREYRGGLEFDCLEVACERLTPVMALDTLAKKELTADKKQILWEQRAKQPASGSERADMEARQKAMKEAGPAARVLIYPARVGGDHADPNSATHLSTLLNEAKLCRASVAATAPVMEGSGWPNEMHVLWLYARNVREYLRQHPADSDYVLFTDYWFAPGNRVWAVHTVLCDRAGEWVVVDLQNSHQEAFQRINPKNLEDCDRLVLDRFKAELR